MTDGPHPREDGPEACQGAAAFCRAAAKERKRGVSGRSFPKPPRYRPQVFATQEAIDLAPYAADIERIRAALENKAFNAEPFQLVVDKDAACFVVRQYYFSNLYDRLSTRPLLDLAEKRWIAFQLLQVPRALPLIAPGPPNLISGGGGAFPPPRPSATATRRACATATSRLTTCCSPAGTGSCSPTLPASSRRSSPRCGRRARLQAGHRPPACQSFTPHGRRTGQPGRLLVLLRHVGPPHVLHRPRALLRPEPRRFVCLLACSFVCLLVEGGLSVWAGGRGPGC